MGVDDLQLDTRVAPTDIDQISVGQTVRVKVQAGNQSTNPKLLDQVSRVNPDVTRDEHRRSVFFTCGAATQRI